MPRSADNRRTRRLLASLAFCVLLLTILTLASAVVKPGRNGIDGQGGSAWTTYRELPSDSVDVLFLGNSHVFVGVDPAEVWRTRGIPSFVLGGPTQQLKLTRFYLAEALKTQRPRVVALELSSIAYGETHFNREFQQINVGYMPLSAEKLKAAFLSTPPSERAGVLVDLWTYHGRWSSLTKRDFDLLGKNRGGEFLNGFLPKRGSVEVTPTASPMPEDVRARADAALAYNLPYLREIAGICEDADAELLLFLTPTGPPNAYSYQLEKVEAVLGSEFDNVRTLDLSEPGSVPGLSYETDFIDGGHLTYTGAAKMSAALATALGDEYSLPDRRSESGDRTARWTSGLAKHDAYLRSFGSATGD
ncbi:MAG: hypothetical protein CVT59_10250 [Actinobacteria bacterium HGW-Actinobacteria-1]|nr:MAG: hypothetical protein CVT59_10250 [Actinobacteria bacterium HGW-Actinobacteria-1]